MILAPPHARILVASKPIDFRKGLPGLSALVETVLQENPFAGDVFIFRSKRADRVKILVWDGTGMWLHYKRLEAGRFLWPSSGRRDSAESIAAFCTLGWPRLASGATALREASSGGVLRPTRSFNALVLLVKIWHVFGRENVS